MSWATFYLVCFVAGFLLSLFSFLGGIHWGLPHGIGAHAHGHSGTHSHIGTGSILSVLSPVTLAAFLAWFGGTGYLLTRYSTLWFALGLGVATISGIIGAGIVFLFLTRVLISDDAYRLLFAKGEREKSFIRRLEPAGRVALARRMEQQSPKAVRL
jgi:hypothetical protein